MHLQQNLQEVISKAFGIPANDITDELEYQSIPEWDSVSHLVLVTELEAAYSITIEMEDVLTMGSVAKIKELLKKYNIEQVAWSCKEFISREALTKAVFHLHIC